MLATPSQPSTLRFLWFALAARRAVRREGYDLVQSHERCLTQDVYRAGEGTHSGYLEAMGRRGHRLQGKAESSGFLERRLEPIADCGVEARRSHRVNGRCCRTTIVHERVHRFTRVGVVRLKQTTGANDQCIDRTACSLGVHATRDGVVHHR